MDTDKQKTENEYKTFKTKVGISETCLLHKKLVLESRRESKKRV